MAILAICVALSRQRPAAAISAIAAAQAALRTSSRRYMRCRSNREVYPATPLIASSP
jgi:hypothetical protein